MIRRVELWRDGRGRGISLDVRALLVKLGVDVPKLDRALALGHQYTRAAEEAAAHATQFVSVGERDRRAGPEGYLVDPGDEVGERRI